MNIESKIHDFLLEHPFLKKKIKYIYQHFMVLIFRPKKSIGNIIKVSPNDIHNDYFFGYYDKSPSDITGRYVLCLKVPDASKKVAPTDVAEILLIDTKENNKIKKIAETRTWNVQQGCMMQWYGPDFDKEIIYNDCRNGQYCSVIKNVFTGKERIICEPIYSVSSDGKFALTLDFSRLHTFRPGYGYSNREDRTKNEKLPKGVCIKYIDLLNNTTKDLIKYEEIVNFMPRKDMKNAIHKVNHIMINPSNNRFMFMHRWYNGNKKISRLLTCNIDGTELYNLSDDNMVSHCCWKSDEEILAFENKKNFGKGYFLMKDKTNQYEQINKQLTSDGHPSYSPNGNVIVTDTYPNKKRICSVKLIINNEIIELAQVFSTFKYDNQTRCDLHPRWSYDGKKIYFDSCHENRRQLYAISIDDIKIPNYNLIGNKINDLNEKGKIKIVFLLTSCKMKGPVEQTLNIIKNLDTKVFNPVLVTIYNEEKINRLNDYLPYVNNHYCIPTSKKDILFNNTNKLDKLFSKIKPDIVHSVGLFPDYYVAKNKKYKQITTLRNYIYDDYPSKFGIFRGFVMAILHIRAMNKIDKVVVCSKSLSSIYNKKLGKTYDYIQNGVDVSKYNCATKKEKETIRKNLNINKDDLVYIYTGQFIERKNIPFLLECFYNKYKNRSDVKLLLLGNGPLLKGLKEEYKVADNIIFYGEVDNVVYYLNASDVYVSTSNSEGLPNGVLEALAVGIPVLLSDIPQHKEIFEVSDNIGYIFEQNNKNDLLTCFSKVEKSDLNILSRESYKIVREYFSSENMSKKYQNEYIKILKNRRVK